MACILVRGQILFYFRVKFITQGVKFWINVIMHVYITRDRPVTLLSNAVPLAFQMSSVY